MMDEYGFCRRCVELADELSKARAEIAALKTQLEYATLVGFRLVADIEDPQRGSKWRVTIERGEVTA